MSEMTAIVIVLVFCTPLGWIGLAIVGCTIVSAIEAWRE